ncbi:hypothetical protein [Streptomyces niveus]|uniref:hypothetical protein n=1 Tax=Streptomyces niveus TaxID=193462 RepID=UPI0036878223
MSDLLGDAVLACRRIVESLDQLLDGHVSGRPVTRVRSGKEQQARVRSSAQSPRYRSLSR